MLLMMEGTQAGIIEEMWPVRGQKVCVCGQSRPQLTMLTLLLSLSHTHTHTSYHLTYLVQSLSTPGVRKGAWSSVFERLPRSRNRVAIPIRRSHDSLGIAHYQSSPTIATFQNICQDPLSGCAFVGS
jgi:hypothetical protein